MYPYAFKHVTVDQLAENPSSIAIVFDGIDELRSISWISDIIKSIITMLLQKLGIFYS